jgi:nucleoside-diphosphate-sugar epimerase
MYEIQNMNDILLIGGNSKLGIAIRNRNIFCGTYVSRNLDGNHNSIFKHSYNQLTADDFSGYRQVLNLIGTNVPDTETLHAVNVDLVHHVAQEARKAGVKSFVNVSSFSVFGSTQEIDLHSQPSPESAYGQSKLQAELALAKMSDANFGVTNVRLPMLYGAHGSKLHMLLNIWAKIRYLPVPNLTARRSMLHYDLAADALLGLSITSGSPMIVGKHLLAPLKWVMPGTYQSLYSSSYLTAAANEIEGTALESRLYQDIHEMAASLYA